MSTTNELVSKLEPDVSPTRSDILTHLFFGVFFAAGLVVTYRYSFDDYLPIMVALACFAVGNLAGFLFGIPRTSSSDEAPDAGRSTNLEDVSDWLTKLLIGAGLVELRSAVEFTKGLARSFASEIDGGASVAFAAATMGYFGCLGLLFGYILTRTYLTRTFARARAQVMQQLRKTFASGGTPAVESILTQSP